MIDPSFQGVILVSALPFENLGDGISHIGYYLPKIEMKYHMVDIDGRIVSNQPFKKLYNHILMFKKLL